MVKRWIRDRDMNDFIISVNVGLIYLGFQISCGSSTCELTETLREVILVIAYS